jgi:hypothetical protein
MTASKRQALLRAAVAAVRHCAAQVDDRAESLLQALPKLPMDEGLRAKALELSALLKDASGRVTFELALLQVELDESKADAATAVPSLSRLEATLMDALAAMADVVDQLESDAERDSEHEGAFVLVIEATGVMLQGLEKAKAATEELRAAMPVGPRGEPTS